MHASMLSVLLAALAISGQALAADDNDHEKTDCVCSDNVKAMLRNQVDRESRKNKEAANARMARMASPLICTKGAACSATIELRLVDERCQATLPYCTVCAPYAMAGETITWTLNNTITGKQYAFGSKAKPGDGIDIKKPTTNRGGAMKTHFKDKTNNGQTFSWTVGPDVTWKHPLALADHGHDATISELDNQGHLTNKKCNVVDPPILNTVN